jgi:hypothetical protein
MTIPPKMVVLFLTRNVVVVQKLVTVIPFPGHINVLEKKVLVMGIIEYDTI